MLQNFKSGQQNPCPDPSWELLFNRNPLELVADQNSQKVGSVTVAVNRLISDGDWVNPVVEDTGFRESLPCGLVLKSIGYKSVPLAEELPFDYTKGIIRQKQGRVEGLPGL